MPRYSRLRESELDTNDFVFYEVAEHFLHEQSPVEVLNGVAAEVKYAQQQKSIRDHIYCVPSTEILNPSKLPSTKGTHKSRAQQYAPQQQQQQNIENGNPNVGLPLPERPSSVPAISSHSSTASGTSLQEQGGGAKGGVSISGPRIARSIQNRSGKWKAGDCESFRTEEISSALAASDDAVVPSQSGQRSTMQRVTSCREAALQQLSHENCAGGSIKCQQSQPLDHQPCTLHSSCNDVRHSQRYTRNPSLREKNSITPIVGPEKKCLAAMLHSMPDGDYGCFSHERSSAVQRSYSTRELKPHPEVSIENWAHHPATRSARQHRVSFSLVETHQPELEHKHREKWREPVPHSMKGSSVKNHHHDQSLRYNYEQPGFVEREKDVSGKPYTIYGIHGSKECPKGSSSRQLKLTRAFSLREHGSSYSRISRAFSVNGANRSVLPVECVSCGEGLGIVVLGFRANEASLCRSCKPHSRSGWNSPDSRKSSKSKKANVEYSSDSTKPSKKKGIMEYCRKLLGLPKKVR